MAYAWSVVVLGHIAGLPVQESLAYVAPAVVVVGWIYWTGRRERRRGEGSQRGDGEPTVDEVDLDALLGAEPADETAAAGERSAQTTVASAGRPRKG
jgi:hypothetical protein